MECILVTKCGMYSAVIKLANLLLNEWMNSLFYYIIMTLTIKKIWQLYIKIIMQYGCQGSFEKLILLATISYTVVIILGKYTVVIKLGRVYSCNKT